MGEPSIDSLHDPYEDQLSAARYKAERDAAMQELKAMREHDRALRIECHATHECLVCEEEKAERLGKLVWRLQNRLARAHRRERSLRKGMREWREKVMGAPVRTVSAYDLLPEEDLQALRWVREQGGFEVVKTNAELFQQLKGERDELREMCRDYKNHGAYGLMLEYRRVLNGVCKRLGLTDGTGKPEQDGVIYGELEKRLIPEGYEWPRFEDGEPVRIGDKATLYDEDFEVRHIATYSDGSFLLNFWTYASGERVKRPAPKVLDADGVEIRVGDEVWDISTGDALIIRDINDGGNTITCRYVSVSGDAIPVHGMWGPTWLTHRATILAADSLPLREGETVYRTDSPIAFVVDDIMTREDGATVVHLEDGAWHRPQDLTHERPDSYDALWEDIESCAVGYEGFMRRVKALAERVQ